MYLWGKAAIRAAGRVLFNPPDSIEIADALCDALEDKPKLDLHTQLDGSNPVFEALANSSKKHKQILDLALELQGRVSGESIHASAFILSPFPILDQMPLVVTKDERKAAQESGEPIKDYLISYDGTVTQDKLGFVKLDLLCLKDLEMMDMVCRTVEKTYGCKINLENLPLDDKAVFDLVLAGNNSGIFQFDGSPVALRILQESGANCIADWSSTNSLNRPGSLQMGYDQEFIDGKKNPDKVKYFTPIAKKYLEETYGTICYQEQIMLLSQEPTIVGFTGGQADTLRKATAKKKADKVDAICAEAREVAKKNNTDPKVTEYFLEVAKASGSYSFNKSHSLAYAVVAYRGAFLKTHFPECFLAAMCTIKPMMKKTNKIPAYLDEARLMGVKVKPPHVNYSMEDFDVPEKGVIAFGLGGIKRVGKSAAPIIEEREKNGEYKDFTDFCIRVPKEVGKAPLEALIKAGALDGLGWSRMAMEESIEQIVEFRKTYFKEQSRKEVFEDDLFGDFFNSADTTNIQPPSIELVPPFETEYTEQQLMRKEYENFEMYLTRDPRDFTRVSRYITECDMEDEAARPENALALGYKYPMPININQVKSLPDKTLVQFVANVTDCKQFYTKKGAPMAAMRVWDNGIDEESRFGFSPSKSSLKCTLFNKIWQNCVRPMPNDVVHIIGRISKDPEGKYQDAILVDSIDIIPPDSSWTNANASIDKTIEFKNANEAMLARDKELSDPSSNRWMIPVITFKNQDDLDAFKYDDIQMEKYRSIHGHVQVQVAGTEDTTTEVLNLKQTRGMVRFAAEYGGIATKTRWSKAQRAMDRRKLLLRSDEDDMEENENTKTNELNENVITSTS